MMALPPLATLADLQARGITVTAGETALATLYLEVASARVRDAAGSPVLSTTSTVDLPAPSGTRLRLPGPPVTGVTAVAIGGVPVSDWRRDGQDVWRRDGWRGCDGPTTVTATYTHGLAAVPADIVDLVCRMVAGALAAARDAADGTGLAVDDVLSERIDDYSVTYRASSALPGLSVPEGERELLAARFGGGGPDVVAPR